MRAFADSLVRVQLGLVCTRVFLCAVSVISLQFILLCFTFYALEFAFTFWPIDGILEINLLLMHFETEMKTSVLFHFMHHGSQQNYWE